MGMTKLEGARRRWVILALVLIGISLIVFSYWLRSVIGPVLLAFCFSYILDPIVRRLQAIRLSRGMSVFVVFVLFLSVAGVGIWFLVDQGIEFYYAAFGGHPQHPEAHGFMTGLGEKVYKFLDTEFPSIFADKPENQEWLHEFTQKLDSDHITTLIQGFTTSLKDLGERLTGLVNMISFLILVPIYLFYFLLDWPRIVAWVKAHLPGRQRHRIVGTVQRIHTGLAAFLRGRIVIAIIKGLLLALGLSLVQLPYAFLIGMLSGLLSILPFVGAALGVVASVILVLVSQSGEASALIWIVVVFSVAEAIEGYVLYPWILSEKIDMHPVTMLVSVLIWGSVLGFFGVLVAIPLTIIVKQLAVEFVLPPIESLAKEVPNRETEEE